MKQNVGGIDKVVRIVLGLGLAWYGYSMMMWWLVVVGVVVFLTGVFGRCALYSIFGFSTCKIDAGSTEQKQP